MDLHEEKRISRTLPSPGPSVSNRPTLRFEDLSDLPMSCEEDASPRRPVWRDMLGVMFLELHGEVALHTWGLSCFNLSKRSRREQRRKQAREEGRKEGRMQANASKIKQASKQAREAEAPTVVGSLHIRAVCMLLAGRATKATTAPCIPTPTLCIPIPLLFGWKPSLLGSRQVLLGWRPLLWRPLLLVCVVLSFLLSCSHSCIEQ